MSYMDEQIIKVPG